MYLLSCKNIDFRFTFHHFFCRFEKKGNKVKNVAFFRSAYREYNAKKEAKTSMTIFTSEMGKKYIDYVKFQKKQKW